MKAWDDKPISLDCEDLEECKKLIREESFAGEKLDTYTLNLMGFFVVRQAIPENWCSKQKEYFLDQVNNKNMTAKEHHPTMVEQRDDQETINNIKETNLLEITKPMYRGNIGVNFVRFIRKDNIYNREVKLHQDICYQQGMIKKYSVFISLTKAETENGSLILYPLTHHLGYLGDAGEINEDILPKDYRYVETKTFPGDIIIMDSSLWHKSPENKAKSLRLYLEINIQDANDPSTKYVLYGEKQKAYSISNDIDQLFVSSRVQRIKDLYREIENYKSKSNEKE